MRIRILIFILMGMRIRMRIQVTKMMRIHLDPDPDMDPQQWWQGNLFYVKQCTRICSKYFKHQKKNYENTSRTRFHNWNKIYFGKYLIIYAILQKGLSMSDAVQGDYEDTSEHVATSKMDAEIPDQQCCGSGSKFYPSRIPDPNFSHPGSQIRIKDWSILTQKIVSKLSKTWSGMFIPDLDWFFTHPGSRTQWSKRHWFPNPDPQHYLADC
jgi:hypothetical protein